MKNNLNLQAQILRRKGHSYREISLILKISKSTAYVWTHNQPLNSRAKLRLKNLEISGRLKGKEIIKEKQELIIQNIKDQCNVLINKNYDVDDYKLLLAFFYWCEGEKTGYAVNFVNSDPGMIKVYLFLLRKCFFIKENKFRVILHLHNYHKQVELINFWSKIIAIHKNVFSVYNKMHTGKCKNKNYKGCLSVRYGDSKILKEIFIIIERFKDVYKLAGLV